MDTIILDLETAPIQNATDYLDPVQAARNLKDPVKIAADVQEREKERLDKLSLDWNLARIVAIGATLHGDGPIWVEHCDSDKKEADSLKYAWSYLRQSHVTIVGFYVRQFDLPMMIARSRYLGIDHLDPNLLLDRYKSPVVDLYDVLTFRDMPATSIMKRSLKSFARRFGVPVPDEIDGKDIPALVAAGEWDQVLAHLRGDLELTVKLAARLGLLALPVLETVDR